MILNVCRQNSSPPNQGPGHAALGLNDESFVSFALQWAVVQVCFPLEPEAWWWLPAGEPEIFRLCLLTHLCATMTMRLCISFPNHPFRIHVVFSVGKEVVGHFFNCWGRNMVYQQGAVLDALHVQ